MWSGVDEGFGMKYFQYQDFYCTLLVWTKTIAEIEFVVSVVFSLFLWFVLCQKNYLV